MPNISITPKWSQINIFTSDTSGLFLWGGTSIEILTNPSTPNEDSKGRILNRSETSNVYYGIPTYIRSTTGTAQIILESWYFNFNSRTFVYVDSTNSLRFSLDIDSLRLSVSSRASVFPTMSTIIAQSVNVANYFGYKTASPVRADNLFQVNDNGVFKVAMIAVDSSGGTYRMYNANNMNEQISGDGRKLWLQQLI